MQKVVRAAGGVIVRKTAEGSFEVLLIHRPKYDDWTVPKGKADGDETDEECALREVEEETGLVCEPTVELESVSYLDAVDRPKSVRYWLMWPHQGEFKPNSEVDEIKWLPIDKACDEVSYSRDRVVIESARQALKHATDK